MQSIVVVSSIKNMLWLPLLIICYISSSISIVEARALRGLKVETDGIICTTAQQCKAKHDSLNNGGSFYSGNYPTKGCFSKTTNNNVYFGTGGSIEDMSTFDLQGVKQRIYCDVESIEQVVSPTNNNEEDDDNTVICLTAEQCQAKLSSLNNGGTFYKSPKYNTKGCFSKTTNNNVYFGLGGSVDEMSTNDLPGKQERVRCDAPAVSIEVVMTDSPTTKPVTESPTTDTPSVQPTNKPSTMSPSMVPSNSPITTHPSMQPTDMEEDLTDWPTYSPSLPPMELMASQPEEDNEDVTVETTTDSLQWDLLDFGNNTPDTTSHPTVKMVTASPTDLDTLEPSNSPSVKPTVS